MNRTIPLFKEDEELVRIRESEQQLRLREKEAAELPRRLEMERKERECTMPPLPEVMDRAALRRHEDNVTRGVVVNFRRDQNRSLMLLFLLLAATAALICWGLKLMQG